MMDYKKLLIKYIYHVMDREGINFLSEASLSYNDDFTKEEIEELEKINNEIYGK